MNLKTSVTAAVCLAIGMTATPAIAKEHLKSLDKAGIDQSISPKQDFYRHVNQIWMNNHPLTPEYSRYGSFNILSDSSENRVQRIVKGLSATKPQKGTNAYKIATLYEQGMDSVRRNREGAAPIKNVLAKIENTKANEMADLFRYMQRWQSSPLICGSRLDRGDSWLLLEHTVGFSLF